MLTARYRPEVDLYANYTFMKNTSFAIFIRFFQTAFALTIMVPVIAQGQEDLASQVRAKANSAVSQFQQRARGSMNFSEKSIAMVEEILGEASQSKEKMSAADKKALVELMGSYVLEVAHRKFGGVYKWDNVQRQPVLVVGEPKFSVALMTFGKIQGRLAGDAADNITFFFQGFSEKAKNATPGTHVLYM